VRIEDALDLRHHRGAIGEVCRLVDPPEVRLVERLAQIRHRIGKPPHLRHERLHLEAREERRGERVRGEKSCHRAEDTTPADHTRLLHCGA
jgi:hypothetical protein